MSIATDLQTIAENVPKVYEAGKKDYLEEVWEQIQQGGNRTVYVYAFGSGFNANNFAPKYSFDITNGNGMFMRFNNDGDNPPFDLKKHLEDNGLFLNTSRCVAYSGFMASANISNVPVIDFSKASALNSCFDACLCQSIEKVIVYKNLQYADNSFRCNNLVDIVVEGEIGKNIWFKDCKLLSKASIASIVTHLSDTQGATLTFSKQAIDNAFVTEDGTLGSASDEWLDLIKSKASTITGGESDEDRDTENGLWTIALV